MSELRFKFLVCYLIAVIAAYFVKKGTYRIAIKAIKEEKLSTGIYSLFPVQGKRAVELAQGHIRGVINRLIIVLTLSRILCCFIVKVTTDAIRRFLDKPQMTDYCAMQLLW